MDKIQAVDNNMMWIELLEEENKLRSKESSVEELHGTVKEHEAQVQLCATSASRIARVIGTCSLRGFNKYLRCFCGS